MRQSHKDVSWLVNPIEVKLADGREFQFRINSNKDIYQVRLYNTKTGEEHTQFRAEFENSDEIYPYVDLMLTEKALQKIK